MIICSTIRPPEFDALLEPGGRVHMDFAAGRKKLT
jgi:hypothetical protein